ncbi:MAG: hypothetical protein AB1724_13370 [Thermodesulfobacteriota bacterium]
MKIRIHWTALLHTAITIVAVLAAIVGGGVLTFKSLEWIHGRMGWPEPAPWVVPLACVAVVTGLILLASRLCFMIPVPCPRCGGRGRLVGRNGVAYECPACGRSFGYITAWQVDIPVSLKIIGRFLVLGPLLLIVAVLTIQLFGAGGPVVFLMFCGVYFVLGPLLQVLVRIFPQPDAANQPTPWGQYFAYAFTYVIGTGAVIAVFRLLFRGLMFGMGYGPDRGFVFLPHWDCFFGACGLIYALAAFSQEGLWRWRQFLAVNDLATTSVAGTAVGLTELSGQVRGRENPDGPPDPSRTILSFFWHLQGTETDYEGTRMLGSYQRNLQAFYLDDGSGRILVDPVHEAVALRRPLLSVLTAFFGRRTFEIVLTGHTEKPSWYERAYFLREGDRAYVIGHAEMREDAPPGATGPERLVIRPRLQARHGGESLLQFLIPFGRKAGRTPHDVFVITDTSEQEARALFRKNFHLSVAMPLALALISTVLIITAGHW